MTAHYDNIWTVGSVAGSLRRRVLAVAQMDMWRTAAQLGGDPLHQQRSFGHADQPCTAMVMALAPDAVRSSRIEAVERTPGWAWDTYSSYPDIMGFAAWDEVSISGTVGDPRMVTPEQGRELFRRTVARLAELVDGMAAATVPAPER